LLKGKAADLEVDSFTGWPSADYNCLLIEVLARFTVYAFDDEYGCTNLPSTYLLEDDNCSVI